MPSVENLFKKVLVLYVSRAVFSGSFSLLSGFLEPCCYALYLSLILEKQSSGQLPLIALGVEHEEADRFLKLRF